MSEDFKNNNSPAMQEDVLVLIRRLQEQITFLERKIDVLLQRSQEQRAAPQHFQKPFASSGGLRHDKGRHERPGEKRYEPKRPFEKRSGDEKRQYSSKKKLFYHNRKDK